MLAKEIMQEVVFSASVSTSAMQVTYRLMIGRMSGFPIADEEGALVGLVTEYDLIRALRIGLALEQTQESDLMTVNVIMADADETVERIIRVPIVANGCVIGIVSRGDVLRAVLEPKAA